MLIPNGVFNTYYKIADEFLENKFIGEDCKLIFINKEPCTNCVQNVYEDGSNPFTTLCTVCNGKNFIEIETSSIIRLRVYHNYKDWIKIGNVEFTDGKAQIIGYLADSNAVLRASQIKLFKNEMLAYKLSGQIFPHGFGSKYFISYIEKC